MTAYAPVYVWKLMARHPKRFDDVDGIRYDAGDTSGDER